MLYSAQTDKPDTLNRYVVPTKEELREKISGDGVGNRWEPIHHRRLRDEIVNRLDQFGFGIVKEGYDFSKDGHDIFGSIDVDISRVAAERYGLETDGTFGFCLGFRSSNMQRFKLLGVSGQRVFVCANGMISGDFVFGHKHTTGKVGALHIGIEEGVGKWTDQQRTALQQIEQLRTIDLSREMADHVLMSCIRDGAIAPSQLNKIDHEYTTPQYEDFAPRNAWSLYNAATQVAKDWRPRIVEKGLREMPRIIVESVGGQQFGTFASDFEVNEN